MPDDDRTFPISEPLQHHPALWRAIVTRMLLLAEYQCGQCCELKCDMISLADIADKRSIEIGVVLPKPDFHRRIQ